MSGVPVLSKIPYVGGLFKYQSKKQSNLERFYLLTPRFVMPGVAAQVPVPGTPGPAPTLPAVPFDGGERS
jgi:type III secretion protein C